MEVHSNLIHILLNKALCVYKYGSVVYGTYKPGISDTDYIAVVPDDVLKENAQFENGNDQYTFYTVSEWQKMLDDNNVAAVECRFLDKQFIVKETVDFPFTVNVRKIREQFSATASNSWVKCKKKLTVEKDFAPRIGKKSLWHALRILDFGIQILKYGSITDYGSKNDLYAEIVECENNDWLYYKSKYQNTYNALKTEFRLAAHA